MRQTRFVLGRHPVGIMVAALVALLLGCGSSATPYGTASAANTLVSLDEDTGAVVARTPTGDYPDGLVYDPDHHAIWTTNETGGSESVIDASTGAPRGSVALGGEVGNVAYDSVARQIL